MRERTMLLNGIGEVAAGLLIRITPFKVDPASLRQDATFANVSDRQASEFEGDRDAYSCNLPIHIPGSTAKRSSNIVLVDGRKVTLGDVPFALFLRLVLEQTRNKNGRVSRSTLINTGFIKPGSEFQSISRLREPFRMCLGDADPEDFIETCEHQSVRLSTHPSLITYDKARLLYHRSRKVRRVAARLV